MKEYKTVYIIAFLTILLLSILSIYQIDTMVSRKRMSVHWENEQIITRVFQLYTSKQPISEILETEYTNVTGLGFYNFYGELIFRYGDSPEKIKNAVPVEPGMRNSSQSIIFRDLLSPFDPLNRTYNSDEYRGNTIFEDSYVWSLEEKDRLIRYINLQVNNEFYDFYRLRARIIQVLTVLLIITTVHFFVNLFIRNRNYLKQIESQERLVVLGSAARTLSHEIKNPLSIIRLQTSIIERSNCQLHNSSLGIINEEIGRITSITERVNDYLRQPEGLPEKLNISSCLTQYISKKDPSIKIEKPVTDSEIVIDRNRFISILDNITNNALESGSSTSDIIFRIYESLKFVTLEISDSGMGIEPENIKRLSDPFFTTKSKGSGLGLSIVSSYVNAAKGRLNITSTPSKGTTLTITFPKPGSEK